MRIDLADSEINRAQDEMRKARRRLGDYRTPCMENPQLFDLQRGEAGESWFQYTRRTQVAAELCMASCRVLGACDALRRVDPKIRGVIAGSVVDDDDPPRKKKKRPKRATTKN